MTSGPRTCQPCRSSAGIRWLLALALGLLLLTPGPAGAAAPEVGRDAGTLFIVDCLLPPQVRQLGAALTYAAARRAVKSSAADCEAAGGEYVAYDRASPASSLKAWLPAAQAGDPKAQTVVGEIFEKGVAGAPDYAAAAEWYLKAAEKGYGRAAIDLGNMFEQGLGFAPDPALAREWFRRGSAVDGLSYVDSVPLTGPLPAQAATAGGPGIVIVEPERAKTRGGLQAKLRGEAQQRLVVIGQLRGDRPISSVIMNGQQAQLIGDRLFRAELPNLRGVDQVQVVAIDAAGGRSTLVFGVGAGTEGAASAAEMPTVAAGSVGLALGGESLTVGGRAHALVVGNNRYRALPDLDTAVADARAVADLLQREYGFTVKLLVDADRYAVLSGLNELRKGFDAGDRLLIYYAGHGELDRVNQRGQWLPVDAEPDSPANWISNIAVTDMLNAIPARQLIVIADSCYSGTMSRAALGSVDAGASRAEQLRLLQALSGARTRTVLTSGGVAPVIDSLDGRHSVFATALLEVLRANRGVLTGLQLADAVAPRVVLAARRVGFSQVPQYAPLKFAGHEAGDFVFVKRDSRR